MGQPDDPAPAAEGEDRGGGRARRASTAPASTSSTARRARTSSTAVPAAAAARAGRGAAAGAGGLHGPPQARQTARAPPRGAGRATRPTTAGIDWAHAEALAFASLLTEGTPIRLTGQDTERGTFSQRHLVLHDAKTGQTVCPIQSLPEALAPLELHNSPLSELACMGFEYGYSQEAPETLVLWEAQFGDFVNSAQVIVDQFIVSGLAKWGQTSRLTLLLPHGYEGSGPEHSSARLERFLALAAEGNIRVASPTTPAQYFHLLRRQARIAKQRPLVVMTPEVAAAPAPGDQLDRRHGGGHALSAGAGRAGGRRRAGHAARAVHGQDLLRPRRPPRPRLTRRSGGGARRAALPVPRRPDPGADRSLPEPARGRCGCRRSRATWARARTCSRG